MHSGICIRVVIEFILFYVIPAESPTFLIEPEPVVGVNTQSGYIRDAETNPPLYKAKLNSKREIEYLLAKDLYTPKGTTGNITSMYEDSKGNLWVATTGQLYLKPDSKDFIIPEFSLPNITSIAEDGHGNIWLATEDSGLHKVSLGDKLKPIKQYSTQNSSLPSNNIDKIVIQENHLWIATTQGSILQMDLNSRVSTTIIPLNALFIK